MNLEEFKLATNDINNNLLTYKEHRLYSEFTQMRNDDAIFAEQYDDTESDFNDWVFDFELDSDWSE